MGNALIFIGHIHEKRHKWTVSSLKNKEQREGFVQKIKSEGRWGNYEREASVPLFKEKEIRSENPAEKSSHNESDEISSTKKRSSPDPLARKAPISKSLKLTINNKKLRAIFKELKEIDANKFGNAASVLTRVFIEGCVDVYGENNNLSYPKNASLAKKVNCVRDHLRNKHSDQEEKVKNTLKGLGVFSGDPNSLGSSNTFNSLIHNPHFSLTSKEIKQNWDRLEVSFLWFQDHI